MFNIIILSIVHKPILIKGKIMQPISIVKPNVVEKSNLANLPTVMKDMMILNLALSDLGALSQTSKQFKHLCQSKLDKQAMTEKDGKVKWQEIEGKLRTNIERNKKEKETITPVSRNAQFVERFVTPELWHWEEDTGPSNGDVVVLDEPDKNRCCWWTCCCPCLTTIWLCTFPIDCCNQVRADAQKQQLQSAIEADEKRLASLGAKLEQVQPQMSRVG